MIKSICLCWKTSEFPRREGGRGTEISTLPGGQNLGELKDVEYFRTKLFKSLNLPPSRLDGEKGFSLGRSNEILRDELKFSKFVGRLRKKFSVLFDDLLKTQLVLKRVISSKNGKICGSIFNTTSCSITTSKNSKTRNSITTVWILQSRWNHTWVVISLLSISRNKFFNNLILSAKKLKPPDQERTCCWYYSTDRTDRCSTSRKPTRSRHLRAQRFGYINNHILV